MIEIQTSRTFDKWLRKLRDHKARAKILARLRRISLGNIGDSKPIAGNVREFRISYGPGYRVYYLRQTNKLVLLLCGGDKDSQDRDIVKAKQIALDWSNKK